LNIRVTLLFFVVLPFFSSANNGASCIETAMTQSSMNQCAGIGYKEADAELNRVYQKIREIYKDDKLLLSKLKKSQLAWIKLRDADFELEYPYTDEPNNYGSSFSMCASGFNAQLTLQRTEYLKRWLIGKEDGDVCSGSQKREWQLEEALQSEYNKPFKQDK
jgi:uncharacterized protein YecT (DUF1311 family)